MDSSHVNQHELLIFPLVFTCEAYCINYLRIPPIDAAKHISLLTTDCTITKHHYRPEIQKDVKQSEFNPLTKRRTPSSPAHEAPLQYSPGRGPLANSEGKSLPPNKQIFNLRRSSPLFLFIHSLLPRFRAVSPANIHSPARR